MDDFIRERIELEMKLTKLIRDFEEKWDASVNAVETTNRKDLGFAFGRTLSVRVKVEV